MPKDALDIGSGLNLADGTERGIGVLTNKSSNAEVDYINLDDMAEKNTIDLTAAFDGDNTTAVNVPLDTYFYVKLKALTYVNAVKIRLASPLSGMQALVASYSPSAGTTGPVVPPTNWTRLTAPVNYDATDPLLYAYKFSAPSDAPVAAMWFRLMILSSPEQIRR